MPEQTQQSEVKKEADGIYSVTTTVVTRQVSVDAVLAVLRKRTAEFAKKNPLPTAPQSAAEKRQARIEDAINSGDFGCRRDDVRKLMAAVTGLPIATGRKRVRVTFVKGAVVYPAQAKNAVARIFLSVSGNDAREYTTGRYNGWANAHTYYRPATDAEIAAFWKRASKDVKEEIVDAVQDIVRRDTTKAEAKKAAKKGA